jgi:cytochrome P450
MSTVAEAFPRGRPSASSACRSCASLPAAWKLRFRGDFRDIVAFSRTIQDGLRGGIPGLRFVYFHRPEYIEAVCVKNDKYYVKPMGSEGLRRFIGNGLLTSEGQFHLRQRRMIQPAFHKKRLDAYAQCMVDITRGADCPVAGRPGPRHQRGNDGCDAFHHREDHVQR